MDKISVLHSFMQQSDNWTQQKPKDSIVKSTILSIKLPVGLGLQQDSRESTIP